MTEATPRIHVHDLVLEVTRRCNMSCAHCLRGDAQGIDMDRSVLESVLDQVSSIGCVTFTGGEPAYMHGLIDWFLTQCELRGKTPAYFYVATNGTVNQKDLAIALLSHYPRVLEPEMCGLSVSVDRFHDGTYDPSRSYLEGLSFLSKDKDRGQDKRNLWVLSRGRASENGLGRQYRKYADRPELDIDPTDGEVSVETVYVSAKGGVCWDCDMPYEAIDRMAIPVAYLAAHIIKTSKEE